MEGCDQSENRNSRQTSATAENGNFGEILQVRIGDLPMAIRQLSA